MRCEVDGMEKYTKYEVARLIGSRALQISMGAPFLVKLGEKDLEKMGYNPIEIAKREFSEGALPITVRKVAPRKREAKAAAV